MMTDDVKVKQISNTKIKLFQKAIYKDYGVKLNDFEAQKAAGKLLDYMNAMIGFNLEHKSKVQKSSSRTP